MSKTLTLLVLQSVVMCVLLNRVVRLSSPNLNYLIIVGAALLYGTVFLYVFSAQNMHQAIVQSILCNVCK